MAKKNISEVSNIRLNIDSNFWNLNLPMVNSESKLPSVKATLLRTLLITSILISAILYDKAIRPKPSHLTVYHQAFRFHVHCPITTSKDGSFLHLMEYLGISNEDHQNKIFQ